MFQPHNTGDNLLYTQGLGSTNHRKLCLDDLASGFTKTEVANWARDEEIAIQKDILSINKNNVFSNFAALPFVWKPCFGNKIPSDDPSFGIPANVCQFLRFKREGRYDGTPLEFIDFIFIKDETNQFSEANDITDFRILDTSDLSSTTAQTMDKFSMALYGLPVTRLPHKLKTNRNWKNVLAMELVADARQALDVASTAILRVIPHLLETKFKMGALKSWEEVKKWIFSYVKISDEKPDVLKFLSVLKVISDPRSRCFTIQSRMITLRDYVLPVLQSLDNSGEKIDLGEDPADIMRGKKEAERYSVFMNVWALQTCLMSEPFDFVSELKSEIAQKRKIEIEEVDIYILLDEKRLIFDRINRSNDATLNLDMTMIDYAHSRKPGEIVKTVLDYQRKRAEAAGKNSTAAKENINFASELVDGNCDQPEVNEIFLVEDNNLFYKRVNKPFGKNFRRFSFKNQYQGRNVQNRGFKGNQKQRKDWRPRNNPKQGFSYSKNQFGYNRKTNLLGKSKTYLDRHRTNTNKFRTKFERYKNFVNKNKVMTRQSGREVVLRTVYDKLNLLVEEMLKDKELETTDFVNAVIEEAEGLDEHSNAAGEQQQEELVGIDGLDLTELSSHSTVDLSDSGTSNFTTFWNYFLLVFQMITTNGGRLLKLWLWGLFLLIFSPFIICKFSLFYLKHVLFRNKRSSESNIGLFPCIFLKNWVAEPDENMDILTKGVRLKIRRKGITHESKMILDTGASRSLVPLSIVKLLGSRVQKIPSPGNSAKVAGGGTLELEDYRVTFELKLKNYVLTFNEALVCSRGPKDLILMGMTDLSLNSFKLSTDKGAVVRVELNGVQVNGHDIDSSELINLFQASQAETFDKDWLPANSVVSMLINGKRFVKNTGANDVDFVCNQEIKTKAQLWNYPVGEKAWQCRIDELAKNQYETNTRDEVKIDPYNEVLPNLEKGEEIKKRLNDILDRRKEVFRGDAGHVRDRNFLVYADVKQQLVGKSCPNYYANMSDHVLKAVIEKFDTEIAAGILTRVPEGMIVQHVLPIFPVDKKDDSPPGCKNFGKVATNFSKVRLIADCSRAINWASTFKPTQADSIRNILQKVADFTKKGFVAVLDISQMFYSFELSRDLWPYFVIEHPIAGQFCYTRLPMGWLNSPSISRLFMMRILLKYHDRITRYLDDLTAFEDDPDRFLDLLDKLLETLWHYNLRLKGSKVTIFAKTIKLLGKTLKNGVIIANEHVVESLKAKKIESIITKRHLKQILGIVNYLAEHLPFKSEMVEPLVKASTGVLADHVIWTESLKQTFNKVLTNCDKLINLHAVDPKKKLYLVVDSSYIATGAFLFQLSDKGEKRFIKIFSRKRTPSENNLAISSCLTELNGVTVAMTACQYEIERCEKPVIVFTDNLPVVKLYNRLKNAEVPSNDKRVNNCFATLMAFDYEIHHVSNKTLPIGFADYISREEVFSKDCAGCRVCKTIEDSSDPFASKKHSENDDEVINFVRDFENEYKFESHPVIELPFEQYLFYMENPESDPFDDPLDAFLWIDEEAHRNQKCEIRAVLRNKIPDFDKDLKIQDLIIDKVKLNKWQDGDPAIREALKLLKYGGVASGKSKKNSKVRSLLETQKAFEEDGLLKVKFLDQVRELFLVVIPEKYGPQLAQAVHNTFGHGSFHRFKTEIRRYFSIKNVDAHLKTVISNCVGCVAYSSRPKILKPMRSFDDDIPSKIGEAILVDEITRNKINPANFRMTRNSDPGKTWRFVIASESLTRYSMIIPYRGNLTSDALKPILIDIRFFLGQGLASDSKMIISMDGCSIHKALEDDPTLKDLNIQVDIRPRQSTSKNHLAMLDGRIAKISKYLNQEMLVDSATPNVVARLAAWKYNNTPNKEFGIRPVELFVGRDVVTQESIKIKVEDLVERRKRINESARLSAEKKLVNSRHMKPINFVPWKKGMGYEDRNKMPLKIGDKVFLDFQFNKNEGPPVYVIKANKDYPSGVDFEEGLVNTVKLDKRFKKFYVWRMDCINKVVPGEVSDLEIETALTKFNWLKQENMELSSLVSLDKNKLTEEWLGDLDKYDESSPMRQKVTLIEDDDLILVTRKK